MLTIDHEALRPLIVAIVRQTVAEVDAAQERLGEQLGVPEAQAAALLGLPRHVLRDCRLRGEIQASRVGKKVIYSRQDLVSFLDRRRE